MQAMENRPVYVRFEYRSVEDRAESVKQGCYVAKDVAYALITPPGGNLEVHRVASEWLDSKRGDQFHDHYQKLFKAWKEGEAEPEFGTSIKSWPVASPSNAAACYAANIKTVEDLATAPAQALQRIGMGAVALQQKAVAWLQSAQDHGKTAEEVATLRRDKEDLAKRVAELTAAVEAMQAAQGGKPKRVAKESKDIELA
jgi:hypothetical protein